MRLLKVFLISCAAWVCACLAAYAACTNVTSFPATISVPGAYCMAGNVTVSAQNVDAITITANGVMLDMMGKGLVGPGAGMGNGIVANNVSGLTIRNGNIRGFFYGIKGEGLANPIVERMDLSSNTFRGVRLFGTGVRIERNRISEIRGYAAWPESHTFAIEVTGPDCIIRYNNISNISPYRAGEGVGVSINQTAHGCWVYENVIRFDRPHNLGRYFGFWTGSDEPPDFIRNNIVVDADYFGGWETSTVNASLNFGVEYCSQFWEDAGFAARNRMEVVGGCEDTVPALSAKIAAAPNDPIWKLRIAMLMRTMGDAAGSIQFFTQACNLGNAEACRQLTFM